MKSKQYPSKKTPAEVKSLSKFFKSGNPQESRDELSMDWSEDIPEVQSSPVPRVYPAEENMSSPRVPLPNRDVR